MRLGLHERPLREILVDLQAAVDKLAALGTTEHVAMELIERGIKAQRTCPTACVLAEYLQEELGDTGRAIKVRTVRVDTWIADAAGVQVVLPKHVGELAWQFDNGLWPQLECTDQIAAWILP